MQMILSDEQNKAAGAFMWEHYDQRCTNGMDAARVLVSVSLESGIGPSVKIICPHCNATKDVTEHNDW